jgi:prefoldin subunit 5
MTKLLLITAIALSGVAEYYAIMGLIAIFAGAPVSIAVMGIVLGVAKIVVTSWLYRNWKTTPALMKTYFVSAIAVLMLLTSMGIFGYLSKAHLEHSNVSGDVVAKIQIYDEKILVLKDNIDANRKALKQFDEAVDQIMVRSSDEKGAEKAVNVRRSQQKERARLQAEIQADQKTISSLNEERAPIAAEVRKVEAEVGPIKYIAALIYGDSADVTLLEKSVRWMILLIVFVFDPLAVLMFIAYNQSVLRNRPAVIHNYEQPEIPPENIHNLKFEESIGAEDEVESYLTNVSTGVGMKIYST